jgi:hypothetical protein
MQPQGSARQGAARSGSPERPKAVYALTERGGKTYWTRVGIAYVNRDDSLTLRLDALPRLRDPSGPGTGRRGAVAATSRT